MRLLSQLPLENLKGKRILLRADFNVPLVDGHVSDDTRIKETIPTIDFLLKSGAGIAICSHLGRPDGKPVEKYSLLPVKEHLSTLLQKEVRFIANLTEEKNIQPGEVVLLENTRYYPEEEANDPLFAALLAKGCDLYVCDAFGTAHRAHASTAAVAGILPSVAGLLLEREVHVLSEVMKSPHRPLVLVLGGAKMNTKIGVLSTFVDVADTILLGGGIANTFLAAKGKELGASLVEKGEIPVAKEILEKAGKKLCSVLLPTDAVVDSGGTAKTCLVDEVKSEEKILDIGPETAIKFCEKIKDAGTILWNGPVGLFETPPYDAGTKQIAQAIANSTGKGVIGGGDTLEAIARFGIQESSFFHVSTGGGAMLEFLEGKTLPGVAALS